jgi:primosomal protein N' (replication factor Y)
MAMGSGTQRIETVLAETFPGLRLGRLDGDTVRHKKQFADLMHAFDTRQLDCLVGTQMVAKGLDNPNVTLVGVIQADAGFVIPDFKSSERTFQMLTQVAGRAGRGEWPGRVIFQVFDPAHPVLGMAQGHDYAAFYDLELETRRRLKLPPFCQLIRFGLSSELMTEAVGFGEGLARQLKQIITQADMQESLEILGPAPCLIPRVNNRYRMHVLIKNTAGEPGHHLVTAFYSGIRSPKTIRLSIDVDCLSLV